MSTIRTAKNASKTNTTVRNFPGSMVSNVKPATRASMASAIHMRPDDPTPHPGFIPFNLWCTGEDSNLRSSKERQIYSLLPLTARPPVHNPISLNLRNRVPQTLSRAVSLKEIYRQCGMWQESGAGEGT